jgi:HEAT repeat protein
VRALADADFAGRARAARTLIAAGSDALPALGRAGAMPVHSAGGVTTSGTAAVVAAVLEAVPVEAVAEALGAPWSNVRRGAALELGKRDRWGAIPRLIDRLDDPVAGVRAASAAALRRLTNNFFGYRALARRADRRVAGDRWRTWWSLEGRTRAREREDGPQARAAAGR